jgi:hypothetical protein
MPKLIAETEATLAVVAREDLARTEGRDVREPCVVEAHAYFAPDMCGGRPELARADGEGKRLSAERKVQLESL